MTQETKGYICATGFKPIIYLLLETFASAILVQCLAERWWDTTYTFHIADWKMKVITHDFHRMIGLRCDGMLINLRGGFRCSVGHLFAQEEVLDGYDQLLCYWDRLQASPIGDCRHSILHLWFNQAKLLEWPFICPKNHDCSTCINLFIAYHKNDLEILTVAIVCLISKLDRQIERYHMIKFARSICIVFR